ncbi:MAG TPA: Uma2 family endonuclease [Firmicutes bacterium]|nr:Uma2 family endonuclease [Bacillota bacterium]
MAQAVGLETTARARPAVRVTFEQFLELAGEPSHSEWVDGEVIILSPSSDLHQEIVELLLFLLKPIVQRHGFGRVHVAPFPMRLPGLDRAREPDLLFVRQDRLHLLKETHLDGAADLVIEVTSRESFARDRGEKFLEYETAGVSEYWLIDPDRQQVELYRLGPGGRYSPASLTGDGRL